MEIFDNLLTFIPIKVNNLSTFIAECARSAQEKFAPLGAQTMQKMHLPV